jgi:hypothetical protein
MLLGLWGMVRLIRRFPNAFRKLAIRGFTLAVTIGVTSAAYVWRQDRQETIRREAARTADLEQARRLDVKATLKDQLGNFVASCFRVASKSAPRAASDYCSCLAAQVEAAFDTTPLDAPSVAEFNRMFAARFKAASPSAAALDVCAKKVVPILPTTQAYNTLVWSMAVPTVNAPTTTPKPVESTVDDMDSAVRDAVVDRYKPAKPQAVAKRRLTLPE